MSKAISRRDFMKVTGAVGAAGLLLPPLLPLPLLLQTRAWHCLTALFP